MNSGRCRTVTQRLGTVSATAAMLCFGTLCLAPLSVASAYTDTPAGAQEKKPWYSWFWPLGEHVEVETLHDEYVPFQTEETQYDSVDQVLLEQPGGTQGPRAPRVDDDLRLLPDRPKLMVELGDGFLGTGRLDEGFKVPVIGAVWQPRLWTYVINRTAVQTFDNGRSDAPRETEIANRMDLFANLQLTGTEKILLGFRPTDDNFPNEFTRYTFEGQDEGFNEFFNFDVETFFFEGDLGSLFPNFDKPGIKPIDFGFTVGRQPLVFQEGILINDTIDAVGLIRNNIPFPNTSNFRVSAMWGWNRLDRNDFFLPDNDANMFGLFTAADAHISTYNLDVIYVDAEAPRDGLYVGASAIQRLPSLGGISTAFRVNASYAVDEEVPGVIGNGVLLTSEVSKTVPGSDDLWYVNAFLGLGNFTQAGREAIVGGPLANTGILFASPSLSLYLAPIDPFTEDDVVGGAIGYQAFFDNKRRNLILEVGGRYDLGGEGTDTIGVGFQLQQAVGRYIQLELEGFYTLNEDLDDGSGIRAEVQIVY